LIAKEKHDPLSGYFQINLFQITIIPKYLVVFTTICSSTM